jgi:hypothetical protein
MRIIVAFDTEDDSEDIVAIDDVKYRCQIDHFDYTLYRSTSNADHRLNLRVEILAEDQAQTEPEVLPSGTVIPLENLLVGGVYDVCDHKLEEVYSSVELTHIEKDDDVENIYFFDGEKCRYTGVTYEKGWECRAC